MIPQGTFDKYEILSSLHESAATAVMLVRQTGLTDVRVLKSIHKDDPDAKRIFREANLLSGFNSPELPTIFDVGEFNNRYYLVEEYVKGDTLSEYLMSLETVTRQEVVGIAIKICELADVLHSNCGEPVIYRDFKPEHIIVTEGGLKLIDFGAAVLLSESHQVPGYGTLSFAPKEQLEGGPLDVRCDVYGVGMIIKYMMTFLSAKDKAGLNTVVMKATNQSLKNRTPSVNELKRQLEGLAINREYGKNGKGKHLQRRIAIVSQVAGVGVTHIAIGLTAFLNEKGIESFYIDSSQGKVLQKLYAINPTTNIKRGVLYHENFRGLMNYGEAVEKIMPPEGVIVEDCGTNLSNVDADIILCVANGSFWKQPGECPDFVKEDNCFVIGNFSNRLDAFRLAKQWNKRVYTYPLSLRGFKASRGEKKLFEKMIKKEEWFAN
ncbi:MAG: serine/threonine protein kinase [Pseudobutyrivibrio sp.]|nr:serine/threonine protein kinase [Pseudobutyrivibrio sp.]